MAFTLHTWSSIYNSNHELLIALSHTEHVIVSMLSCDNIPPNCALVYLTNENLIRVMYREDNYITSLDKC